MTKENALGLVPNEIVGLRIRTDEHNYTIVLVKRHGASSKYAGQTYDMPLGYHKKLDYALDALLERAVRLRAEGLAPEDTANSDAWALRLKEALEYATTQAKDALKELREDLAKADAQEREDAAKRQLGSAENANG